MRRPKLTRAQRAHAKRQRAERAVVVAVIRWIEALNTDVIERLNAIVPTAATVDRLAAAGILATTPAAVRGATLLELQLAVEQAGHRLSATFTAAERRKLLRLPREPRKTSPPAPPAPRRAAPRDDDVGWAGVWSPGNPGNPGKDGPP